MTTAIPTIPTIPIGDGQVTSGSASLAYLLHPLLTLHPLLKTEVQTLEREQNERDVLDAGGDYKCTTEPECLPRMCLLP